MLNSLAAAINLGVVTSAIRFFVCPISKNGLIFLFNVLINLSP
jgi:hypothetical protein